MQFALLGVIGGQTPADIREVVWWSQPQPLIAVAQKTPETSMLVLHLAPRWPWLKYQAKSSTPDSSVPPGWRAPDLEGVFLTSASRG